MFVNTQTSVGSIPTRVCSKILMFGLLDAQKIQIFAACARSMLILMLNKYSLSILFHFLCSKKGLFLGSECTNIGLFYAHSCSRRNFDVRARSMLGKFTNLLLGLA